MIKIINMIIALLWQTARNGYSIVKLLELVRKSKGADINFFGLDGGHLNIWVIFQSGLSLEYSAQRG